MSKVKMYQESWYKEIEELLDDYKSNKARVNVLKVQLMKDCAPDTKMIAKYGESVGKSNEPEVDPKEQELIEKEIIVKSIEKALEGLKKDDARTLVEYRYFKGYTDTEVYLGVLKIGQTTYYKLKNETIVEIANILGKRTKCEQFTNNLRRHKAI